MARVETVSVPLWVRLLRGLLLCVWLGFLPAWLLALRYDVQPSVRRVVHSLVVWMVLWAIGHVILRRARCPACGDRLIAGEAFESLRTTQCASCEREFGRLLAPPAAAPARALPTAETDAVRAPASSAATDGASDHATDGAGSPED